ncbi:hypothetical protein OROMI_006929 [Orobanche minor]
MWSINLIVNKLMKAYEEKFEGAAGNDFNFIEAYSIKQSKDEDQCKKSAVSNFIEVPHINQEHTWDCGLACVIMVLRALGVYDCNIQELEELCCTTSVPFVILIPGECGIWTVDLAYLLQKFSVSFTYCTVTLGANPDFSVETFYKLLLLESFSGTNSMFDRVIGNDKMQDQLPNDLIRVNMLFQEARESGILIECRSVSATEISGLILSGNYVVIALVDQYKLSHSGLEDVCVSDFYGGSPGYTGHYVVICGYDAVTNEFEIRDPASLM